MDWNAALYRKSHGFVAEYGKNLLACVPEDAGQCILDFGCGTGELTAALARKAGQVIGVDQSAAMIRAARAKYPGPEYHVLDAAGLAVQGWTARFDLVFSNAVFHWIQDQDALLRALHAGLRIRRPGQRGGRVFGLCLGAGGSRPDPVRALLFPRTGGIPPETGNSGLSGPAD